ncbi:MAG TPA: hypothetical protein VF390_01380 [Patescibacteria group bacterium]
MINGKVEHESSLCKKIEGHLWEHDKAGHKQSNFVYEVSKPSSKTHSLTRHFAFFKQRALHKKPSQARQVTSSGSFIYPLSFAKTLVSNFFGSKKSG